MLKSKIRGGEGIHRAILTGESDGAMKQLFSCTVVFKPQYAVVYLSGELDTFTAEFLFARLAPLAASGKHVVVDLSGLSFLGTIGPIVLADLHRCASAKGGSVQLAEVTAMARRVLTVTRMRDRLTIATGAAERVTAEG
jgi:anti-anti-sigma factor